jgi:ketosteroid isomerase-like protein
MSENQTADAIARAWLAELEACVGAQDFARGRTIFAEDAVAFGSVAAMLVGLDALEQDQWQRVWPFIRAFRFAIDEVYSGIAGPLLWLACPWTSEGVRADGTTFARPGRMTAILQRRDGRWLAVHTHFSLVPS